MAVELNQGGRQSPRALPLLLPVKRLAVAKERLATVLNAQDREDLVLAMLADVIAAGQAAGLAPMVMTPDTRVLSFAEDAGARPVPEPPEAASLNAALERALARDCAHEEGALVLLPDTPLVIASELQSLATAGCGPNPPSPFPEREGGAGSPPRAGEGLGERFTASVPSAGWVALAADRSGRGTNAIFLRPPAALPLRFGPSSLVKHREAARRAGLVCYECPLPGIALDLDTAADLRHFLAHPSDTRTYRFLADRHVAERLRQPAR